MNDSEQAISLAQTVYQDINEWLKFTEAKHAALLAAWIALWIGIISIDLQYPFTIVRYTALICIMLCASINFLSFFPFLNKMDILQKLCRQKYDGASNNVLFYISIFIQFTDQNAQSANQNTYKINFMNALGSTNSSSSKLLDDYLEQIVDVSTVVTIKVYLFALSLKLAVVSFIIVLLSLLIA